MLWKWKLDLFDNGVEWCLVRELRVVCVWGRRVVGLGRGVEGGMWIVREV